MREVEVEFDVDCFGDFLAFHHCNRSFEKLAVESKSHCGNVARLLRPEKISRSAQFKVAHGKAEPRSKPSVAP